MISLPRSAEIWGPGYLRDRMARIGQGPPKQILLALADHFEPFWKTGDEETAARRVSRWAARWPEIAAEAGYRYGAPPKYTFFYPEEEYRPHLIDMLVPMVESGIADVEVHIHHDGEGEQNFVDRISAFTETLFHRHGLLRKRDGRIVFGFIHGSWALDNSLPDGRCCGLNNELTLLEQLGCYADFTLPASNPKAQTRSVNTIYWATDDPSKPKSHDSGRAYSPGAGPQDGLLMIPGPLGLRWLERGISRIERGEIAWNDVPTAYRCRRWIDLAPRVAAQSIVKLYSHGATEKNSAILLDGGLRDLFRYAAAEADRCGAELKSVSAFDIYCELMGRAARSKETALSAERR